MATTAASDQMPQMARLSLRDDASSDLDETPDTQDMTSTRRSESEPGLASASHAGPTSSPSASPSLHPLAPHPSTQAHIPRPRSPYTRSHLRSQSAVHAPAPPIARAHSAPALEPTLRTARSPAHSPVRSSSPLRTPPSSRLIARKSADELFPGAPYAGLGMSAVPVIESIAEDAELSLDPAPTTPTHPLSTGASYTFTRTSSSSNLSRRPSSSPLQHSQTTPIAPSNAYTGSSSPFFSATRLNEHFPAATTSTTWTSSSHSSVHTASVSAGSSIVSTPTSFRSRSPSISSLETIPDSPDAERAAIEADEAARLKAAVERASAIIQDHDSDTDSRRASLDHLTSGSGTTRISAPSWGSKDKRKRWSVCGAERRGDFEMETIWED